MDKAPKIERTINWKRQLTAKIFTMKESKYDFTISLFDFAMSGKKIIVKIKIGSDENQIK